MTIEEYEGYAWVPDGKLFLSTRFQRVALGRTIIDTGQTVGLVLPKRLYDEHLAHPDLDIRMAPLHGHGGSADATVFGGALSCADLDMNELAEAWAATSVDHPIIGLPLLRLFDLLLFNRHRAGVITRL